MRYAAEGRIGLRATHHGFGTPDRRVRVEDNLLLVDDVPTEPDAIALSSRPLVEVYAPTTDPVDADLRRVDPIAARAIGDWFAYCESLLSQLDSDAEVTLWPEHFDIACVVDEANFGGSPGDAGHPEPYLYVGPWGAHGDDPYWNEPFGASLSYAELLAGADGLEFLRRGRATLR